MKTFFEKLVIVKHNYISLGSDHRSIEKFAKEDIDQMKGKLNNDI